MQPQPGNAGSSSDSRRSMLVESRQLLAPARLRGTARPSSCLVFALLPPCDVEQQRRELPHAERTHAVGVPGSGVRCCSAARQHWYGQRPGPGAHRQRLVYGVLLPIALGPLAGAGVGAPAVVGASFVSSAQWRLSVRCLPDQEHRTMRRPAAAAPTEPAPKLREQPATGSTGRHVQSRSHSKH